MILYWLVNYSSTIFIIVAIIDKEFSVSATIMHSKLL